MMVALPWEGGISSQMTAIRYHFNLKAINFCITGLPSTCGAGGTWHDQRACRFFLRSSHQEECLYYNKVTDGHCGCLDAQKDAMTIYENGQQQKIRNRQTEADRN
jgi:hypothetical protein